MTQVCVKSSAYELLGQRGTHVCVVGSPYKLEMTGQVTTHKFVVLSANKVPQSNGDYTHYLDDFKPHVPVIHTFTHILV